MSEPRTLCIVCSQYLPTGYRGRPRVVCSDKCYGRRRTILGNNATRLAEAKGWALKLTCELSRWPDLFGPSVKLFDAISATGPEVTDLDRENQINLDEPPYYDA